GGGPRNYGPKELAAIFRKLRDASGQLFTNKTEFLITEQSAHILLTETFDLLAKATTRDRLTEIVDRMRKEATAERKRARGTLTKPSVRVQKLPVFTEEQGRGIVKKVKDCVFPPPPR